jgi:uncharacterized Ntn-hydrolase superfamily protein
VSQEPFEPDAARFRPADSRTQEELGGVLERAFARERGAEPDEDLIRRYHVWADEALAAAEGKLALVREAEAAMAHAAERYGHSQNPSDLAELQKWTETAELYRREAGELRIKAETLRQYIA